MISREWESEISEYRDPGTGAKIWKLTSFGNNYQFYFTENSFNEDGRTIIFRSDRAESERKLPHEKPKYNLFMLDLITGRIVQLTDELESVGGATKTPDGGTLVYVTGKYVKALDTKTGESRVLYKEMGNYSMGAPSIELGHRYCAFTRNEKVKRPDGPNYAGFKERYYRIKDGRIRLAYLDGSGSFDVWKDSCEVGHFQFSPVDGRLGTFCHEGPWNLVTQRIWFLDFVSREARPCFRQDEDDSIGHEFWTQDGYVFFDNRGPGHDGTITSDRTQAVASEVAVRTHGKVGKREFIPYVGLVDTKGDLVKKIDLPYYCNHYHANPACTKLVGDDLDDLVLIDIGGNKPEPRKLCSHGTSWHTQTSHCHPTWSWDGKKILYASDRGGFVNLYLIEP